MNSFLIAGQSKEASKQSSLAWWYPPPRRPGLHSSEVHVWRARLDRQRPCVRSLKQVLSADERARAERFCFEQDREHFIVSRGLLRIILSRYLDMEPSQLHFCYNPHGKPGLIPRSDQRTLNFNVSHSGDLALFAFASDRKIGIDLERTRIGFAYEQIAERFFSPREKAMLSALQEKEMRHRAFFNCWTRKEAYIKARGEGLSFPLDQFDVSLAPGEPARLLNASGDPLEAAHWSLHELSPGPGYVAALALEGCSCRLACWEWHGP